MGAMDREMRQSAALVTTGVGHGRISRVKSSVTWMASRTRTQRAIGEMKAESIRIFQIRLAMLSAQVGSIRSYLLLLRKSLKGTYRMIDEVSYHQNNHNATCNVMLADAGDLSKYVLSMSGVNSRAPKEPVLTNSIVA